MKNFLMKHPIGSNVLCMFAILAIFIFIITLMPGCNVVVNAESNKEIEESFVVVEENNMGTFTIYVVKDTKYGNEYIISKCLQGIGVTPRYEKATVTNNVRNLIAN